MRRSSLLIPGLAALLVVPSMAVIALREAGGAGSMERSGATTQIEQTLGRLPLSFIENRGQMDPRVSYYVQGSTTSVYFTAGGITFSLSAGKPSEASSPDLPGERTLPSGWARQDLEGGPTERYTLKLDFVGADPDVTPVGTERSPGVVSYFTGPQESWHTGLPTFSSITYPDLWPGIDLVYSGTGSSLKYTFHVDPGADPSQIRLAYRGATGLDVNEAGALEVATPLTTLTEQPPYSYQDSGGRQEVRSSYALNRKTGAYGFELGDYDRTEPLVIDPVVVTYAGYIGGAEYDYGSGVAVDEAGNAYVTGWTSSSEASFPVKVGPDLTYNGGDYDFTDAFVAKVDSSGETLIYAGYIGGSADDYGSGVAVDEAGNAYVAGSTGSPETSFPVKVGPDLTYNGDIEADPPVFDAFVAKVEPSGETLAYAGYIGGESYDAAFGVAVADAGNAYVTGSTRSDEDTFPVKVGPDLTHNGLFNEAFVAKVAASGETLAYAGYIGGASGAAGSGVAVDGAGNAYVTGWTSSNEDSFPVKVGPDLTFNGYYDAFVAKVVASGETLAYAGYIGGAGDDYGTGVAVDGAGNAYVAGYTLSSEDSFPVEMGPDLTYNGSDDAFVAKVEASGESLGYAGYIGGVGNDTGHGIAVDRAGSVYIAGFTTSDETSFPVKVGPDLTYNGGNSDAFVANVEASGESLGYAGYIGGAGGDAGHGVAVNAAGDAHVTGQTTSDEASFPVTVGPDLTYNGFYDAFVAKILSDEEPGPVCTTSGTSGHDAIQGTGGDDVICAKAGNDTVSARAGDDTILGGTGHDTLVGGRGSDVLRGGTGDDVLITSDGIEGNDTAWGGPGEDVCVIDEGDETFGCDEVQVRPGQRAS